MDKPLDEYGKQPIWTLNGISEMFGDYCLLTKENNDAYGIVTCKPLLRPLSSLTEEIEHNGERFVPIEELQLQNIKIIEITNANVELLPYWAVQKLHEWHFDIHGLIDRNLALPIDGKEVEGE